MHSSLPVDAREGRAGVRDAAEALAGFLFGDVRRVAPRDQRADLLVEMEADFLLDFLFDRGRPSDQAKRRRNAGRATVTWPPPRWWSEAP